MHEKKYTTWLLVLFLALCSGISQAELILMGGNIIDPVSGDVVSNKYIHIVDGKIKAVLPDSPDDSTAPLLDLTGKWLIPGLVDMHTHLGYAGVPPSPFPTESTATRALKGVVNARSMLEHGFTTVRNLGTQGYAITDLKHAIDAGLLVGPTIYDAGKFIIPFGSGRSVTKGRTGSPVPFEAGHVWEHSSIMANTPGEMVKAVRENIYYGANVIKLITDQNPYHFSEEEVKSAVDEAHQAGITVAMHAGGGKAARMGIIAGVDTIEHGFDLDEEMLRLMKRQGTALGTTDFPLKHLVKLFNENESAAKLWSEKIIQRLQMAYKLGVTLVFGSDAIFEFPGMSRGEMALDFTETWVKAGIPNLDILRAMTVNSYRVLKIEHERGRIAPGYHADLVVLSENPLKNILALRTTQMVIKEGRIIAKDSEYGL